VIARLKIRQRLEHARCTLAEVSSPEYFARLQEEMRG
jgi:hypothetical protein